MDKMDRDGGNETQKIYVALIMPSQNLSWERGRTSENPPINK